MKGKGEKDRYTHLNADFQRIASRDAKAFLSDKRKQIEENNRMGKSRNSFKKTRYQGNISCKDGHNKGEKCFQQKHMISRRGGKNIQNYTKKIFTTRIITMV